MMYPDKKRCIECGSARVYEIEFRTDYTNARKIEPVNNSKEINNEDLPYYLDGYYCDRCKKFVSIH